MKTTKSNKERIDNLECRIDGNYWRTDALERKVNINYWVTFIILAIVVVSIIIGLQHDAELQELKSEIYEEMDLVEVHICNEPKETCYNNSVPFGWWPTKSCRRDISCCTTRQVPREMTEVVCVERVIIPMNLTDNPDFEEGTISYCTRTSLKLKEPKEPEYEDVCVERMWTRGGEWCTTKEHDDLLTEMFHGCFNSTEYELSKYGWLHLSPDGWMNEYWLYQNVPYFNCTRTERRLKE